MDNELKRYRDLMRPDYPIGIIDRNISRKGGALKLSGQGMTGSGWKKAVGGTLVALGGTSSALNASPSNFSGEGIVGGAIMAGLGAYLIHSDKKSKNKKGKGMYGSGKKLEQALMKHIRDTLNKLPKHAQMGSGLELSGGRLPKKITNAHVKKFIQIHKDKAIDIKHIFGSQWKQKGQQLLKAIEKARAQHGGNIFSDIGHAAKKVYKGAKSIRDKAFHKVKQFVQGKTKYKPSMLLGHLSTAVGLLGTASGFVPGLDVISVPMTSAASFGLRVGSKALEATGRGTAGLLEGNIGVPYELTRPGYAVSTGVKNLLNELSSHSGSDYSKSKIGLLLGITGASLAGAYGLYKVLRKKWKGKGMMGSGKIPNKIIDIISKSPFQANQAIQKLLKEKRGRGLKTNIALGAGGLMLYGWLKENPHMIDQIANAIKVHMGQGGGAKKPPKKFLDFMMLHPEKAKMLAMEALKQKQSGSGQCGSGWFKKMIAGLGIAGLASAGTLAAGYKFLLDNPMVAQKIAIEGGKIAVKEGAKQAWKAVTGQGLRLSGQGLSLSGGKMGNKLLPMGCSYTPSGRIKCDKYSVWAGIHKKTRGGLTKADLMLKGRKVISKRKHQIGKGLYMSGKGLYKNR